MNHEAPTIDDLRHSIRDGKLDLSRCSLKTLPSEIGQLTNLRLLWANGNQLTELPREIGQLANLHELQLDDNRLTELPHEIGQLAQLRELQLDRNRLTELPREIGQLAKLKALGLRDNQLTELPREIGNLVNLEVLCFDGNDLDRIPLELGQLINLKALSFGRNKIAKLLPQIANISKIEILRLDANALSVLSPEVCQLTNLRELRIDGNRLAKLPPEIGQLVNLQLLWIGTNELISLPPEIGRLTKLRELRLEHNKLCELPSEIGKLVKLHLLHVADNNLTALPPQLADRLDLGCSLKINQNPLIEPIPQLFERGPKVLATYLRSLEGAIPHDEAKILLVGEGNVGKSSLIAALRNEPFVEGRPTTHGIEIKPLAMLHPDLNVGMTVRAWDFGGQEVYRITHQFYLSKRALYLVVWNARKGQEQDEVESWLRRIRLRVSQDARALVVATHCDERRPELDYPNLKRLFPALLVGQFEVDNRSGRGIEQLHRGIAAEIARLPQMGQLVSPRWITARDDILALDDTAPLIPFEKFAEICRSHEVHNEEIRTLAELLHDLGQVVYYGNDEGLRDFVILNPEWFTKAISYVLEDAETARSLGVLDHARLKDIWQTRSDGPSYPQRYHPYFLRLMEKFDVSYRLEDDEYRSLVAQLVPHERPALAWDSTTLVPEEIRSLALVCQLSETVPGLIAWLTVRHHRASTGAHWRNGVFLRHPIDAYASEALIELISSTQLALDVRAPSPDLYFNVIRDSIEDLIIRRWPGLTYQLFIPCPTYRVDNSRCSGQFPLDGLLRYREQNGMVAHCWQCDIDHDVSALLTGFSRQDRSLQPELIELQDQLANVVSGVKRLEGYAAEAAGSIRRVLRTVGNEVNDCPRLFTLSPESPGIFRRLRFIERRYRLILWCEQSGQWHPWLPATYHLDNPQEWLIRTGPYIVLVSKALQLVVPIAASVAGVALSGEEHERAKSELELMKTLVAELPDRIAEGQLEEFSSRSTGQLTLAEGQALRALRILLFQKDHSRAFGGLRRVHAPSGDFLWVCPDHYVEYDPGLPRIPAR